RNQRNAVLKFELIENHKLAAFLSRKGAKAQSESLRLNSFFVRLCAFAGELIPVSLIVVVL
ncbi:MAG TPA: hypothetical protein VKA97_03100, partial [Pyrinomonadaceae bacterium]|nr:hypothetical protein [Pyrinomonadaceae bacterium]